MTSALVRAAQVRVPLLMRIRDDLWRGYCPVCSSLSKREQPGFYVFSDYWHCRVCGISGTLVDMLEAADGLERDEAVELAKELEAGSRG